MIPTLLILLIQHLYNAGSPTLCNAPEAVSYHVKCVQIVSADLKPWDKEQTNHAALRYSLVL